MLLKVVNNFRIQLPNSFCRSCNFDEMFYRSYKFDTTSIYISELELFGTIDDKK